MSIFKRFVGTTVVIATLTAGTVLFGASDSANAESAGSEYGGKSSAHSALARDTLHPVAVEREPKSDRVNKHDRRRDRDRELPAEVKPIESGRDY